MRGCEGDVRRRGVAVGRDASREVEVEEREIAAVHRIHEEIAASVR